MMHVALLVYFITVIIIVKHVSAAVRQHDGPLATNSSCQSLVTTELIDRGRCDCFQQVLEIRCQGLTAVPRFSGFDAVFAAVHMANQSIRALRSGVFADLPTRRLVLSFNDIEDRMDASAFGGNLSEVVRELYLGACRLTALPAGLLDNMHQLVTLHLWHNNIREIPAPLFVNCCGSLRELLLSHNLITSLDADTFTALRNLRKLDLDSNRISSLSPDLFNGLGNLRVTSLFRYILASVQKRQSSPYSTKRA